MAARLGPTCPEPEMPFPPLTAGCQQKQEGIREELQVTTPPSPASLPNANSSSISAKLNTAHQFCPFGEAALPSQKQQGLLSVPADSNDLWQHRQEPSPQVAGLTDAQTPRNNSSRSKSTVPVTRSNPATPNTARLKLRHKWFREFVCLVCPSLRSCWLGCRGENQGWICTNCRDYIIICSLYA